MAYGPHIGRAVLSHMIEAVEIARRQTGYTFHNQLQADHVPYLAMSGMRPVRYVPDP
jgi:hypothetical protein